jgi:hypothetical protein
MLPRIVDRPFTEMLERELDDKDSVGPARPHHRRFADDELDAVASHAEGGQVLRSDHIDAEVRLGPARLDEQGRIPKVPPTSGESQVGRRYVAFSITPAINHELSSHRPVGNASLAEPTQRNLDCPGTFMALLPWMWVGLWR